MRAGRRRQRVVGIQDGSDNPSSNGRRWQFGPFKVTGTVTRTDNTTRDGSPDCAGADPLPQHTCGGPRKFSAGHAYIYKSKGARKARFHLEFDSADDVAARLFADAKQCFGPDTHLVGGSRGFSAPWPGDQRMNGPHGSHKFSGTEYSPADENDPAYLPFGDAVPLDINTTYTWTAQLRTKCEAAGPYRTTCQ